MEEQFILKAVIWDMDGTLLDTESLSVSVWEEVLRAHGYENPRPTLLKLIGRTVADSSGILRKDFGKDFPLEEIHRKTNHLIHEKTKVTGFPVKKGIVKALEWITASDISNAVASSAPLNTIQKYLGDAGLKQYFNTIVSGDHVTNGKPHPEIFLLAAQKLNVAPEQCIVFEDSYNGVLAANAAGMRVVMIPDLIEATEEIKKHVHYHLQSGEEIIDLLTLLLPKSS